MTSTTIQQLTLAGTLFLGLNADSARAGDQVPFRSTGEIVVESITSGPAPGTWLLRGRDTGNGTHLGRYTSVYEVLAWPDGTTDGTVIWKYEGRFTSTAANGDTLRAHLVAAGPADASGLTAQATVISGTGRFANVQGAWTSQAFATPTGFTYESTGFLTRAKGSAKKR